MTSSAAGGGTSISPRRSCGSRRRSGGSTAGPVGGSAPSRCPGPGRAPGTPGTSRTSSPGWPSGPTRPASAGCCGVSWEAVQAVVTRVVAEHLDDARLDERVQHRCRRDLLQARPPVPDRGRRPRHRPGRVRRRRTHRAALHQLLRRARPRPLRPDPSHLHGHGHASSASPRRDHIPQAAICFDPFHVDALGQPGPRRRLQGQAATTAPAPATGTGAAPATPCAPASNDSTTTTTHSSAGSAAPATPSGEPGSSKNNSATSTSTVDPDRRPASPQGLDAPPPNAADSDAFVTLARRIRRHFDGIVAAVEHGLSNSRLEGINAKIRLINKPRLRPPQRRTPHRHDPPLPRRHHHPPTHTKVRRGTFVGSCRGR